MLVYFAGLSVGLLLLIPVGLIYEFYRKQGKETLYSTLAPLIKKDMVAYIGPVFEELKTDIRCLENKLENKLDDRTHGLGVLIDKVRFEILDALEPYSSVSAKEEIVKGHGQRISILETEMGVVKTVLQRAKDRI